MLRVELQDVGNTVTMRLEGRFVGPFAKDTRDLVMRCKIPPRLIVNLSEVTFVDAIGEEALSWLARIGGEFVAENCYPLHVCERLHLPMAPKCAGAPPGDVTRSQTSQDSWRCSTARKAWSVMRTQGKRHVVREDVSLEKVGRDLEPTGLSKRSPSKRSPSERSLSKRCAIPGNHDPLYLFACHVDWQYRRNLAAYQGLVSALDDSDNRIRQIAEMLVHRSSPRPPRESRGV